MPYNSGTVGYQIIAHRPDLSEIPFDGRLDEGFKPFPNHTEQLTVSNDGAGNITGFQLKLSDDSIERYDPQGRILSVVDRQVNTDFTYSYDDPNQTITITDDRGRSIVLTYNTDDQITQAVDPDGHSYLYSYGANGMLSQVTYPGTGNPTRLYHYENTQYTQALTGITDEQGNRYATWSYDSSGRAISSKHYNGAEKVTVDYTYVGDSADSRVTVTNELGKSTTKHFQSIHGVRRVTQVEGLPSTNCAAANKAYTYGANGFLASKTDWQGNTTTYTHNAKGQELRRTEAVGTPEERTVTTEWHLTFNLPTKITEPGRETVITYDANGNELSRSVTALP